MANMAERILIKKFLERARQVEVFANLTGETTKVIENYKTSSKKPSKT